MTLSRPRGMTKEECGPLPIWHDGTQCISCWRPSWRERLSILFFGRIWLSVFSGMRQPPVWVWGTRTPFDLMKGMGRRRPLWPFETKESPTGKAGG